MTIVVLLVLAAIWTAVLLPPYLEKRRAVHPTNSIVDFRHKLAVLQRTGDPYAPAPSRPAVGRAMTRGDAQRRRRDVLATLAAAAVLTLLLAFAAGGVSVWLLHLLVDAALLGYIAMLMQVQQQRYAPAARQRAPMRAYGAMPALATPQQIDLRQYDLTDHESYFVDEAYEAEPDSYDNVYELPVSGRVVHPSLLRRAN